ncbi:MAG: hypothetical protein PHQ27_06215, partial [Victivallales bacterium]|nr:hypothetical protein [Victivallales bacterium]
MGKAFLSLVLLTIFSLSGWAIQDRSLIDDRENWDFIIDYYHANIAKRRQLLQELQSRLQSEIKRFDRECRRVDQRSDELRFLLWNQSGNEVFGISLYGKQITDLSTSFDQDMDVLDKFLKSLESYRSRYLVMEATMTGMVRKKETFGRKEKIVQCIDDLRFYQCTIARFITECQSRAERGKKIQQSLHHLEEENQARQEKLMKEIIFSRNNNFFSLLPNIPLLFGLWWIDVARWLAVQIPDDPFFWRNFLLMALLVWLPLFFSGRMVFLG